MIYWIKCNEGIKNNQKYNNENENTIKWSIKIETFVEK